MKNAPYSLYIVQDQQKLTLFPAYHESDDAGDEQVRTQAPRMYNHYMRIVEQCLDKMNFISGDNCLISFETFAPDFTDGNLKERLVEHYSSEKFLEGAIPGCVEAWLEVGKYTTIEVGMRIDFIPEDGISPDEFIQDFYYLWQNAFLPYGKIASVIYMTKNDSRADKQETIFKWTVNSKKFLRSEILYPYDVIYGTSHRGWYKNQIDSDSKSWYDKYPRGDAPLTPFLRYMFYKESNPAPSDTHEMQFMGFY